MNAPRDENRVPVALGTLYTDGTTLVPLQINPVSHTIGFNNGTTNTDFGPDNSPRDGNRVTTWTAVSKIDGVTPVPVYFTADGKIMVDTT